MQHLERDRDIEPRRARAEAVACAVGFDEGEFAVAKVGELAEQQPAAEACEHPGTPVRRAARVAPVVVARDDAGRGHGQRGSVASLSGWVKKGTRFRSSTSACQ